MKCYVLAFFLELWLGVIKQAEACESCGDEVFHDGCKGACERGMNADYK